MSFINLKDITVSYDGKVDILKKLNIDIEEGKLVSLLGPSGCGKTTTLRVVAGFIQPKNGQFICEKEDYTYIPVHKRNFGLVFQSYALFPHLTVFDNVAFGLKMQKVDKKEIKKAVEKILEVVDLKGYNSRYPKELSGGQRQRVALARALVIKPKLLLLDEPLSNLDAKLRLKMRAEIRKLQQKLGITTIFVTHDQEECFSISDKVAVMNGGLIEQYDTPEEIYTNPSSEFVARFVGFENFIELDKIGDNIYQSKSGVKFITNINDKDTKIQEKLVGTIRPDNIKIINDESETENNILEGIVDVRTYLGKEYQYSISTEVGTILVNANNEKIYDQGNRIKLYLQPNKLVLV
ncbi:ABC transporter ATP-binding protein [Vallitalea sp.]|jgi:putative spermidine/putrescine transport system ATP-binding protein|uniref:ABC transporter ATP-binding protein n=1 Tax=Vallitalea sp. TaxID=1882829 RepID=UPI0025D9B186|nr:ABC transporter ATP-binding protein [Vallitalea sp.]MCT4686753.1 ABC transporter ATP-binding protein [Vallitalea sp.]